MAFVHRMLTEEERQLLGEGWKILEPLLVDFADEKRRRRYFHLYKRNRGSDVLAADLHARLLGFAARLQDELLCASLLDAGDELTHHGYMVVYPGAPAQDWHIDYDGDVVMLYAPITRETERNATQYLQKGPHYHQSVQFINRSDREAPLIYNERHSVHRGIENSEWYRRVVFYCYFAKPDWQNDAPLFERADRLAVNVDAGQKDAYWPEEER